MQTPNLGQDVDKWAWFPWILFIHDHSMVENISVGWFFGFFITIGFKYNNGNT
jgi:hypothetical protein